MRVRAGIGIGLSLLAVLPMRGAGLTLEEALEEARAQHPDAAEARARLSEAEAVLAGMRGQWQPQVSLRIGYQQTTNPLAGFGAILSQGTFAPDVDFNNPGRLDAWTGTVEGRYRLYAGGGRAAGQAAAEAMRAAVQAGVGVAEAALADAVVTAYFGLRQADAKEKSIASGVEMLKENLRVSRVREEAGELISTERLNIEVELAALERTALEAANNRRLARMQLGYLLGRERLEAVEIASEDGSLSRLACPLGLTTKDRPELVAAKAAVEAADEAVRAARSGRKPTLDAYASWQADRGWERAGEGSSWTAGIVLSLPVFDGARTEAATGQATARERAAREHLRRVELSLQLELEQARLAHDLARAQREVASRQEQQAKEAARLSRDRFAAGTLLSTELIGVESRLVRAQVELAVATWQERAALAHLRRTAGLNILE